MNQPTNRPLLVGLVALVIVLGIALALMSINQGRSGEPASPAPATNVLENSNDDCVVCHKRNTPGIIEQYGRSTMAAADVTCRDCHEVKADYPGATEHEGAYILASPTAARCEECHNQEVAQYNQSRHALPAYVAYNGAQDLPPELLAQYEAVPEGSFNPDRSRNAIYQMEGPDVTRFTCESCHNIGKPAADGSVGQCQKCHLRHEFSLEQARKPETCNACHIGPDHPQYEIYVESPHGIAYATSGDTWNWDADPGTLTPQDFPAPTCATCHMSGFGGAATTHDVGERLTWYLFAPVSERRPAWQDNQARMQSVCLECHNQDFVDDFYGAADKATARVNDWVLESRDIIQPLKDQNLLTAAPFDEPIDFTFFNLWHHWGRTAKFGIWMQGPDYAQWHGVYEIFNDLAELRQMVKEKLQEAQNGASGMEP